MKAETLLSKDEIHKAMLAHVLTDELIELATITKTTDGISISFEDVDLTDGEVVEIIRNLSDSTDTPQKQSVVITPDGSLGVTMEVDLK